MALSIGTLVGYLSLDDTNFTRKADAADRKINGLKLHLEALKRTNPKISVEVDTQTAKLDELKVRIAALKAQAAEGVDVRVDMVEAMVKIDAVQAKLRALHNEEVKVKVDVDDTAAVAKVEALSTQLDALQSKIRGNGGPGWMMTGILGLGPTVLPMLAAAAGGVAAIGSGAVAAAGGIGVLKLAYHGLSAEVQAYAKYQLAMEQATTKAQRASAQHALQASAYGQAGAPAKSMTRFLISKGTPAYHQLQGTAQRAVFPGTEQSLKILLKDLPVADRLVARLGHTMGAMEVQAAHALNDPFWRHFFDWLGKTAQTDLPLIGSAFGNTFEGIARIIKRFSPQGTSLLSWIDGLTKKFNAWTAGGSGSSFAKFMRQVPEDAQAFTAVMKAAGPVVGNLLKGLNKAGVGELHLLADGLSLIAKIPPGPLQQIGKALPLIVLGLKGIGLARAGAAGLVGVASTLSRIKGLSGLGGFGGKLAGEAGGVALGKGVVPVYVTNSGFGGAPGKPGGVGGSIDKYGVPLVGTLATVGAVAGLVTGGLAAENLLINHLQRFKPSTLKVPYAPNINDPSGGSRQEMSPSAIRAAQMNVHPADLKAYNEQLTKLIALDRKLYPAANSAQAGVDALGKGFQSLIAANPTKAMGSLQHISDLTGITIKHLAQLVPGLGAALKDAGIPATRLGVELASLPKKVQTAVTTPGAIGSMADIKRLQQQYNLTPKQVRTIINLLGGSQAIGTLAAIQAKMDALHSKDVTVRVNEIHATSYGPGAKAVAGSADGSMVPKGGPYRDRYLYALAPGEQVTTNRNGQADRARGALKLINKGVLTDAILGLAGGGTAGHHHLSPAQRRKRALAHRLGGAQHALGHTNSLIGNADTFGQAFAGNVFGAGLPTTHEVPGKVFTTSINGQQVTETGASTTAPLSTQQILKQMLAYQHGQRTQARGLLADVARLRKLGVSKSLLGQMQSSGAQGVAQIHALASGSRSQVQQFNKLNSQTTSALHGAGAYAAAGQSMAALQRQKSNEEATVRAIKKGLHGVSVQIKHSHLRVN